MRADRIDKAINGLIAEELVSGRDFLVRVLNSSMCPFVRPNDKIVVTRVPFDSLTPGDIVVFQRYYDIYVHRLLSRMKTRRRPGLITKGDNSLSADAPISEEEFLGKAVTIIRQGSRRINLETKYWKTINRLVSFLSCLQAAGYDRLRRLKKVILLL